MLQGRDYWRAVVNMAMKILFHKKRGFPDQLRK
jgi:hypothetical protein